MRSLIRSSVFAVVTLFSVAVWGADLEKGLAAFAEGDYATALAECQPLADSGSVGAMVCLGRMYANGFGVDLSDEQALKWYGLAAAEGNAEAQYNLGVMHANGWGVAMNEVPAAGYYRLAAEQGYVPAQVALAYSYKHGAGVEKDLGTAYMWFDIAARHGEDMNAQSECDDLAKRMSEDEVYAARRSALQWLEGYEGSAMHADTFD